MNVRTLMKNTATATAFAAITIFAGACAHKGASGDYGHVETAPANMTSASTEAGTAVNNNGDVTNAPATPVTTNPNATPIAGPAKVDSSGNAYTSSAAPATGNASNEGTNTNVNVVPKKVKGTSSVTYSEAQNLNTAPTVTTEVPAPVVTTPTVTETTTTTETTPMTSSVTEQTTTTTTTETTHKRMRKD